jgi:succinate-semialdehyde dehydrogenase/glutarate-semialdehyde dehydrogenase
VLDIVPWNFPFWMPFKSMIPPLVLGNPILMKHAPSTPLCAEAIEKLFHDAGFDQGEYSNLYIDNEQAASAIADKRIRGLKFTGSTRGGKQVAELAGRHMKQGCFELGGSDPFVVLDDSDVGFAVEKGYISRMVNNGQACINAKRFIVHESVYEAFKEAMIEKIKSTARLGDPMDKANTVGPLAVAHLTEHLRQQVRDTISQGAKLAHGSVEAPKGMEEGNFFEPLVLENISPACRAYTEELFGPVFSMYKFKTEQEAIELANTTDYGLGAAVFSQDIERAEKVAR